MSDTHCVVTILIAAVLLYFLLRPKSVEGFRGRSRTFLKAAFYSEREAAGEFYHHLDEILTHLDQQGEMLASKIETLNSFNGKPSGKLMLMASIAFSRNLLTGEKLSAMTVERRATWAEVLRQIWPGMTENPETDPKVVKYFRSKSGPAKIFAFFHATGELQSFIDDWRARDETQWDAEVETMIEDGGYTGESWWATVHTAYQTPSAAELEAQRLAEEEAARVAAEEAAARAEEEAVRLAAEAEMVRLKAEETVAAEVSRMAMVTESIAADAPGVMLGEPVQPRRFDPQPPTTGTDRLFGADGRLHSLSNLFHECTTAAANSCGGNSDSYDHCRRSSCLRSIDRIITSQEHRDELNRWYRQR